MDASIQLSHTPSLTRLVLRGDFDIATGDLLSRRLQDVLDSDTETVTVDAVGVSFVDAGSLRRIDLARQHLNALGRSFVVGQASTVFERVCRVAGYSDLLPAMQELRPAAGGRGVAGAAPASLWLPHLCRGRRSSRAARASLDLRRARMAGAHPGAADRRADGARAGHGGVSSTVAGREDGSPLSARLADVARELQSQRDVRATMETAVLLAKSNIDAADEVGLAIVSGRKVQTSASTGDMATEGDRLQYELGEGPCLDAIREQDSVCSADLASEWRWPTWGPQIVQRTGARSVLSFPLFTHDDDLGALTLYSEKPDAFTDEDRAEGEALASHVAVAVAAAQGRESLIAGMDSRSVIGQAMGIVMERFGLTPDVAFSVLTRLSSTSNVKLRDIAVDIVTTRQMPGERSTSAPA